MYEDYDPKPINTSDIAELPVKYRLQKEEIAEYLHDVWARRRLDDGWTYGKIRDDDAKKHPDLLPYSELPDSEKQYDRDIAEETIKLLIKLGYDIKK